MFFAQNLFDCLERHIQVFERLIIVAHVLVHARDIVVRNGGIRMLGAQLLRILTDGKRFQIEFERLIIVTHVLVQRSYIVVRRGGFGIVRAARFLTCFYVLEQKAERTLMLAQIPAYRTRVVPDNGVFFGVPLPAVRKGDKGLLRRLAHRSIVRLVEKPPQQAGVKLCFPVVKPRILREHAPSQPVILRHHLPEVLQKPLEELDCGGHFLQRRRVESGDFF